MSPVTATTRGSTRFDVRLAVGFSVALALLALAGTTAILTLFRLERSYEWVNHTHEVIRTIDHVANSGLAMQSSARGYLASGQDAALSAYEQARSSMEEQVALLRRLTRDNRTQQQRLDQLEPAARQLRDMLDGRIQEHRQLGTNVPGETGAFARGQETVARVRGLLDAIDTEEDRLLSERLDEARRTSRITAWATASASAIAALIIATAAVLIRRDSRKRREAENRARDTAANFESLYNHAPCGYHSLSADGTVISVNDTELKWLGYQRDEVVGRMRITEWMTPASVAQFERSFPEFTRSGEIRGLALEWVRRDGSILPVIVNADAVRDPTGRFLHSRATVFDNTAPVRAQEALRQSEERLRLMFEGVSEYGIIMLDPAGRIVQWNPGAERVHGYGAAEIINRHFSCLYLPEMVQAGAPELELRTATATGRFEDEGWRMRKDGTRFWANVVVSALRDPTGELRGFVKVTRDLTERRNAEQQIKRLNEDLSRRATELEESNRELEAFSYSVSHDLRAPLRHIDGFAGLLATHPGAVLDEEGQHYLSTITRAARQMGKLIDNLLAFSRVGRAPLRLESVNQDDIVANVVAEGQYDRPGQPIEWKIAPLPEVCADGAMLRQVWVNLISNAVKYSGKQPRPRIEIGGRIDPAKQECVCYVRDNGVGFDMAYVDKLFGVFQRLHGTTEFEGTGIGLANVRRVIDRHGGRTWAEGAVGHGATFYFSLPTTPHAAPQPPTKSP